VFGLFNLFLFLCNHYFSQEIEQFNAPRSIIYLYIVLFMYDEKKKYDEESKYNVKHLLQL